jgi:uncharacterized protein YaiE (UPF0345 family)
MKHLFVTLSLAACLISSSSFASGKITPDVWKTFYHTFSTAQDVTWTEVEGMLRIGFTLNGQQHFAYYSDGELVVVATAIKTEALPIQLQNDLAKYSGYVISEIYELGKNKTKEYYVVLDNASKHIVLKGTNKWSLYLQEQK